MPMYVVRSYLPHDTILNFNLVDNDLEPNTIIQAKSAINLNNIQHIDLPGTMKDIYNLTIKLKFVHFYINVAIVISIYIINNNFSEKSSASIPPVSITYHMNIDIPEIINDSYFTIEDLLNGKFSIMDSDLQWPFIGKQFSNIKWKQSDLPDTQTTIKVKLMLIFILYTNLNFKKKTFIY